MNDWACVGCRSPHWESGVYVSELTIHPDCRRHSPLDCICPDDAAHAWCPLHGQPDDGYPGQVDLT